MYKQISAAEVKQHRNKNKNVWIIIHNEVYDVTQFLNEHPGGEDSLMDFAGKDGTQGFEDVGHSQDARELMKKYKIGFLPANERSTFIDTWRVTPKTSKGDVSKTEKRLEAIVVPRESSNLKWWLLALAAAIIVGVSVKKYTSQ